MSIRLLHEDLRQNLQETLGNFLLKGRDVQGKLVQGHRQSRTQSRGQHGVQHGGHFVFDALFDRAGQHTDAGKNGGVNHDRFFLATVGDHLLGG